MRNCKSNKTFSIIVIMINANDILCGIYLTLIWIVDISYIVCTVPNMVPYSCRLHTRLGASRNPTEGVANSYSRLKPTNQVRTHTVLKAL